MNAIKKSPDARIFKERLSIELQWIQRFIFGALSNLPRYTKLFVILLILAFAGALFASDKGYRPPLEILKQDGYLALCDSSSYFVFAQDGTFSSFPVGVSGRILRGTWKSKGENPVVVTATAKMGWVNGMQPQDEYRRLVFAIYGGHSEPFADGERYGMFFEPPSKPPLVSRYSNPPKIDPTVVTIKNVYRGYFLVEEFTKISKPE